MMKDKANLDILRSIAVCCVLFDHLFTTLHSYFHIGTELQNNYALSLGHAGVLAFFVHTSLVLMYSLERLRKTTSSYAIPFYIRRFFRIYPLSIAAVLWVVMFHVPYTMDIPPFALTKTIIAANLLLIQNVVSHKQVISSLWSLPYEVQMYITLPFFFMLASRKKGPLYIALSILLFVSFGIAIFLKTGHLSMAAYVPCFLGGILCYSLRHLSMFKIPSFLWVPFLAALFVLYVFANPGQETSFWSGWIFCIVLGLMVNEFCDSSSALVNTPAKTIATYSYGIYLLHAPILFLILLRFGVHNVAAISALFIGLTTVASIAAFHLIESPFINFGKHLTSARKGSDTVELQPAP